MNIDTGVETRLGILESAVENDIMSLFRIHNWECEIEGKFPNGEYLIVSLKKGEASYRLALMYTSATANGIYKILDKLVDLIVINGSFYHLDSFSYGISTKIIEKSSIQSVVLEWNEQVVDGKLSTGGPEKPTVKPREFSNYIQSEDPIKQIWSRIKQFKSIDLARKLVHDRFRSNDMPLNDIIINSKAEGLAYCVQNGCDYFEAASKQKLNQRIVSLYYGGIAFASAEMLASPNGPISLDEVEAMTKNGHGLYTFDSKIDNAFEGFIVGVLSNGFYKQWVEFLGCDVSLFPPKKPRKSTDIDLSKDEVTTLIELFSRIPELEGLFLLVTDSPVNWLNVHHDSDANDHKVNKFGETYVIITDISCSKSREDIAKLPAPIFQIEYQSSSEPGLHFKCLIKHSNCEYWHGAIDLHRSPFTSTSLIVPIFGTVKEYRAICIALLYALSILVRYRPSIWRQVVSGKHEKYLVLTEEFLDVYERIAPQEFLNSIIDNNVYVTQPGSMFSRI